MYGYLTSRSGSGLFFYVRSDDCGCRSQGERLEAPPRSIAVFRRRERLHESERDPPVFRTGGGQRRKRGRGSSENFALGPGSPQGLSILTPWG